MKIVNLTTFLSLPAGTLFSKYTPYCFGELYIKSDSIHQSRDFLYREIVSAVDSEDSDDYREKLDRAEHHGESISMDFDTESRDGTFEDKQLFAVWESEELQNLITCLQSVPTSPQ
jgi:hypothetical protein